ncbi:MAG: hypothetical protein ACI4I0_00465 [Acutalibacteraceae bacterium]
MAVALEVLRHFDSGIDGHLGLPGGGAGDWKTPPDFYARGTEELSEILHKLADS